MQTEEVGLAPPTPEVRVSCENRREGRRNVFVMLQLRYSSRQNQMFCAFKRSRDRKLVTCQQLSAKLRGRLPRALGPHSICRYAGVNPVLILLEVHLVISNDKKK
ncbi:uncharacterized [Tachysurus ichikawai]